MLADLLTCVDGPWRTPLRQAGIALDPPLAAIKVGAGGSAGRQATYLVFAAEARAPGLVLQVASSATEQGRLLNAHRALTDLWAIPALHGTLPRPVGVFDVADLCVVATSPLPGVALDVLLRRGERSRLDQVRHDLFRAQVWLQLMQEATSAGATLFEGRAAVDERLALLHHIGVPRDDRLAAFASALAEEAADFHGLPLPLTGRHGAFGPSNLLIDQTRLGVVGWRAFGHSMTPLEDIFGFAVGVARGLAGPGRADRSDEEAFHRAFLEPSRLSDLVVECIGRYLRAMHLPPRSAHLFFGLFLFDRVISSGAPRAAAERSRWLSLLVSYAEHARGSALRRLDGAAAASGPGPHPSPERRVA